MTVCDLTSSEVVCRSNVVEDQRGSASLNKRIEPVVGTVVDIGYAALLQLRIDDVVVGRSDVVDVVLHVLVVGLDGTAGSEHEAVAEERAAAAFGADLDVGGTGHIRLDESRSADAEILSALLGVRHNRAYGEQEGKKGDFLHSFLNLVTAILRFRGKSLNGAIERAPLSEL